VLNWPASYTALWGTWTGPLYVLTDNRTYSSAEMFTATLQNNKAAKVVGLHTGGDGCGFVDDSGPVELPHSHLRFQIPNCVRTRADGGDEVAGVEPDLPILQYEGENARGRAQRAVDAIAADAIKAGRH
jgi:C-terminal processing protease CtpA/Prc